MKPKKIWANLAVNDLEKTSKFYSALGFKSNGNGAELTSFSFGKDAFVINFFTKVFFLYSSKSFLVRSSTIFLWSATLALSGFSRTTVWVAFFPLGANSITIGESRKACAERGSVRMREIKNRKGIFIP